MKVTTYINLQKALGYLCFICAATTFTFGMFFLIAQIYTFAFLMLVILCPLNLYNYFNNMKEVAKMEALLNGLRDDSKNV